MTRIIHILSVALLLGAMLCGCRPGAAEARLIAIDSLTATAPDSALALLAATDTATLSEADRAYHALLTSQALYKAYIPATDSTAITRAWAYYSHHGPYDRRVRTMIHRGTTAEEMGLPDQAMLHYKQAEDYARPNDHFNRGYALMSMGLLYQNEALAEEKAVSAYRKALTHFQAIGDKKNALYCQTEIARLYQIINLDSAEFFLNEAIHAARLQDDSLQLIDNWVILVNCNFMKKQYTQAIHLGKELIFSGKLTSNQLTECAYALCHSYTDMGKADSARYIYELMPPPLDYCDSIRHLRIQAEIARAEGNMEIYLKFNTESVNKSSAVVIESTKSPIYTTELNSKVSTLKTRLGGSEKTNKWFRWIIGLIALGIIAGVIYFKKTHQRQIVELHHEYAKIKTTFESEKHQSILAENEAKKRWEAYTTQLGCVREFFELILHAAPRRSTSLKADLKRVDISEEQWDKLLQSLDILLDGFVSDIINVYGCNKNFAKVFCLCYCGASNNVVELCVPLKMQTIANVKQKLAHRVLGEGNTWTDLLGWLNQRSKSAKS